MTITIREYTTAERKEYEEEQYRKFLEYYLKTNLTVTEIMEVMDINNRNYLAKYIRKRIKDDGYNSNQRYMKIRNGEWI